VIDTSPDLREQLIDANVDHIDAVFLTHEHADQTHGIDDLRSVVMHQRRRIPVYLNRSTADHILLRFSYCFVTPPAANIRRSWKITLSRPAKAGSSTEGRSGDAFGLPAAARQYSGARLPDRRRRLYADLSDIPAESWPFLKNLDLWIIDGLRYAGHPSHFSINDALAWIDRFKPRRAVITNMHSDLDYEVLRQNLPPGVIPAFDGMRLTLEQAG